MVIIYHLLAAIDTIIYGLASSMFRIIYDIATTEFFKPEQIETVANRIYIVVGVLMLFKLVISAVQYMINPDVFDDKDKGMAGILKKIVISIALIVVVPSIFNFMIAMQGSIIKTLPSIILGSNASEKTDDESIGFDLSFQVLQAFVKARDGKGGSVGDNGEIHDLWSFNEHVTDGCPPVSLFGIISTDNCEYDYMIIVSTLAGGFLCYVLLSMILDIAIRTIKFGIIRILAPIPISSYIFSKDKLSKFAKTTITVYTDLFIRMAIVYFIIFAIQEIVIKNNLINVLSVNNGGVSDTGDWFRGVVVNIAIIFGLLMFASKAPKFISELLGLPDVTSGDMADMFKPAWQRVGGFAAPGAAIGAYRNARDYGETPRRAQMRAFTAGLHATGTRLRDIASGKSLSESYKTSKDAAAARTSRNLEYANRYPDRRERQKQIWQERVDKYTGVTTGGKRASSTISAANAILEGRNHSWSRAESKVLESPGKYTSVYSFRDAGGTTRSYTVSQMLTRMKEIEAGGSENYTGEYKELVEHRQDIIDYAKLEFIQKSFSNPSGDPQQRNVFAEDIFKIARSGGDPKEIGKVLKQTFTAKDPITGAMRTYTVDLLDVAKKVADGTPLTPAEAEAVSYYVQQQMNKDGGTMRVKATQTQTSEPKSS